MKLAAIDIGSNSIHMIIARIDGDGNLETLDRAKEMARLGEETLVTGYLSEAAQERGIAALRRLRELADRHKVDDIIAVATSATREARNGSDFIERVEEECGVHARIISGVEEGRLIYLGTREVYPFGSQRALIIDIGGGSVELIVADQRREYLIQSLRLGVRRLRDRFLPSDPSTGAEVKELYETIRGRAEQAFRAIHRVGFDVVLVTSGTAHSLTRLCHGMVPDLLGECRPQEVTLAALAATTDRLVGLSGAQLDALTSIDDRRRDTIVPGAMLLRTLVEMAGVDRFQFCDAALREGMIVEYLERHRPELRLEAEVPDPRRRSVLLLARRLTDSTAHAQTVARLAGRLFDDSRSALRMGHRERELLEYAALLHNVGKAIHRSSHHKHALYIIRHAELVGFEERERLILANLARYHRRSHPKARHPDFMELLPADRDLVKRLTCVLRLANALDRSHRGNVHTLHARVEQNLWRVRILAFDDPSLELGAAREQAEYIRMTLGWDIDVREGPFES